MRRVPAGPTRPAAVCIPTTTGRCIGGSSNSGSRGGGSCVVVGRSVHCPTAVAAATLRPHRASFGLCDAGAATASPHGQQRQVGGPCHARSLSVLLACLSLAAECGAQGAARLARLRAHADKLALAPGRYALLAGVLVQRKP
eukprot:355369-Chlamydomonas_euryale.AAC.15